MKKFWRTMAKQTVLPSLAAGLMIFSLASAASAKGVATETVKPAEVRSGTYNLITTSSPAPIALLQRVGAPYEIKLATSGSGYNVTSGLTEDQALSKANEFLKKDSAVVKTDVKEIKGPDGSVVGYELTPVYRPLRWGSVPEITGTTYKAREGKVWAYVTPDAFVQNETMGGA